MTACSISPSIRSGRWQEPPDAEGRVKKLADHFSTIGIHLESGAAYEDYDLLTLARADRSREESTDFGTYLPWAQGAGAELWCHLDPTGASRGFVPHFVAGSRFPARLEHRVIRPDEHPLDGGFWAWALGDAGEDLYPFVFDVPDFRAFDALVLPLTASVGLACFAHTIDSFADEQALRVSGTQMAVESFIPTGTFRPGGEAIDPPQAEAFFLGRAESAEERTNPVTDRPFWRVMVRTLGGAIDVVADPEIVATPPSAGAVISVSGWLTGRPERGVVP